MEGDGWWGGGFHPETDAMSGKSLVFPLGVTQFLLSHRFFFYN